MKKGLIVGVFSFILVLSISGVFAQSAGSALVDAIKEGGKVISGLITDLNSPLRVLLGDIGGTASFTSDELFFGKLLIFIILMSIVWAVCYRIPLIKEHEWVLWTVSIVVPLLGIRFFTAEMVLMSALPSTAFAVALTCFLPVAFWFYFVFNSGLSGTMRKVAWIVAFCIFLGVYFIRFSDLGSLAWLYVITGALCILFLIFDGTIQNAINRLQNEKAVSSANSKLRAKLMKDYNDAYDSFYNTIVPMPKTDFNNILSDLVSKAHSAGFSDLVKLFNGAKAP